jgi:hypothetical protein
MQPSCALPSGWGGAQGVGGVAVRRGRRAGTLAGVGRGRGQTATEGLQVACVTPRPPAIAGGLGVTAVEEASYTSQQ